MTPEWQPPAHLRDPYVCRLQPSQDSKEKAKWRAQWVVELRGRLPGPTEHAVAQTLAAYGNKDGSRCRPGITRLAADLSCSSDTVKRTVGWLDEHGWITRTNRDETGRGHAAEFQLTLPAPVAATLGRWLIEQSQWIERPPDVPRRPSLKGGHPRTPSRGKGCTDTQKGCKQAPKRGAPVHPHQGSTHQVTSPFREVPSRPHADASGRHTKIKIRDLIAGLDPDDIYVAEELQGRLEEEGYTVEDMVTFESMIGNGQPLARVVAVTIASQQPAA